MLQGTCWLSRQGIRLTLKRRQYKLPELVPAYEAFAAYRMWNLNFCGSAVSCVEAAVSFRSTLQPPPQGKLDTEREVNRCGHIIPALLLLRHLCTCSYLNPTSHSSWRYWLYFMPKCLSTSTCDSSKYWKPNLHNIDQKMTLGLRITVVQLHAAVV